MRFISFLFCSILLYSCSKKTNTLVSAKKHKSNSKFQLTERGKILIDKNWIEIDVTVERAITDTFYMNITNQFMHSDRDDIIKFSEDGSYIFDEGKTKARLASSQIYQKGFWHLNENLNQLTLSADDSETHYEIKEISNKKLILELPIKNDSIYYSYILTFIPK